MGFKFVLIGVSFFEMRELIPTLFVERTNPLRNVLLLRLSLQKRFFVLFDSAIVHVGSGFPSVI